MRPEYQKQRNRSSNVVVAFSDSASKKVADPAGLCIAFHSKWMKRAPDKTLERDALHRRESFPVAAVVVVHDDISLMRESLEAVSVVVEFVVSVKSG